MSSFPTPGSRFALFFLVLVGVACSAIWAVGAFVTQDGPAHVLSASFMLGLLRQDPAVVRLFAFNSFALPNSTGHWLLALLLNVVSPLAATKILATLTYAGLVAAVGFLRLATVGREGLATSLLIGAAIGFNWLWLCGLNNFLLGAIGVTIGLGLFHVWRESLTLRRVVLLSLLVLLVYFSHLVAFGILAASLVLSAACVAPQNRRRTSIGVFAALSPALLLAVLYRSSVAGGDFFPVWRRLADPLSIASWLFQIRAADPFILISRRAFPFSTATADAFAVFTPLLWLLVAFACLIVVTIASGARPRWSRANLPFAAMLFACAVAATLGPDDFGTSHGTLMRERLALLGSVFVVPLFRAGASSRAIRWAQCCLVFVVLFQTAALWEYALRSSRDAEEFLAMGDVVSRQESVASVVVLEDGRRFHSNPTSQMSNFLGIGRRTVVWDNYEIGYDLFPVVARRPDDGRFVLDLTSANVFDLQDSKELFDARLAKLDACLAADQGRIGTVLTWCRDSRVEAVLYKWFEAEPFFELGRGRLYRRRADRPVPTDGRAAAP